MNPDTLKRISLNAPIAKVRYLLENIIVASNGAYQLKEKKETHFSSSFLLQNKHYTGYLHLALIKITDDITLWRFESRELQNSSSNSAAAVKIQEELLAIVQEGLEGKPITTRFIRENKNSTFSRVSKAFGSLLHFS